MSFSIAGKMWREASSSQESKGFKVLRNLSFAGSLYIPQRGCNPDKAGFFIVLWLSKWGNYGHVEHTLTGW